MKEMINIYSICKKCGSSKGIAGLCNKCLKRMLNEMKVTEYKERQGRKWPWYKRIFRKRYD